MLDGNARLGGPSRRVGGRDERPPQSSSPTAVAACATANPSNAKRWIPQSVVNKSPYSQSQAERNDVIFRRVRGILNKLTPEKFDKLSLELLNVGIDKQTVLKGIILLIFEKALDEPKYSSLYAQLCHRLFKDAPNFEPPDSTVTTFRRLLLSKCQDEFENRSRATEAFEKDGPLTPDEAEQCSIAKAKMLGNIKFIGELGKLEMVQEGILHKCIKQLIERKKIPTGSTTRVADMSEDMECLCEILRTVGRRLDHERARPWMDKYFERIKTYQADTELPSRIRFMLQDAIELRANGWQPRKLVLAEGAPKTIQQVRDDVAKESGVYIPKPPMLSPSYFMTDPFFGPTMSNRATMSGPTRPLGMSDMFSALPSMYMSGIGTGPGVIHMDNYTKTGQQGSRQRTGPMNSGFDSLGSGSHRNEGGNGKIGVESGNKSHYLTTQDNDSGSERSQRSAGRGHKHHNGDDVRDKQHFQKQTAQQGNRELPPRFQRKQQQMQQKDCTSTDVGRSQSPSNYPPTSGESCPSPPGAGMHFQPTIYAPMMPPMMMGPGTVAPNGMVIGPKSGSGGYMEDISLRPARNFTPLLRPNTPATLPKSAQSSHPPTNNRMQNLGPSNAPPSGPLVQKQITVIQVPSLDKNKDKNNKLNGETNKDQLKLSMDNILKDLLESKNVQEAVKAVVQLKPPKKFMPELICGIILQTLDRTDDDCELISSLIGELKDNHVLNSDNCMEAFILVLDKMPSLEQQNALSKSNVAKFAAGVIANGVISIADVALPLAGGFLYPLFLLCLQQLTKLKGKEWLSKAFHESKVNVQSMLPELDHNKERMIEILEDRGLGFLFPLLRIQSELWKQIKSEPNPQLFYKYLRDCVDSKYTDEGFITILITAIVRYVSEETTMKQGVDQSVLPDKALIEQEKELLEKYKSVLQKFLLDRIPLHVTAIYALQTFSFSNGSPKGLLLRMFMNMYNFEILDEEAFMKWKEEVNDLHPGKGQALFQVNHWLTWLEQAEEESEEEN